MHYQWSLRAIAIGLLSAVGTATLAATPLAAQTVPTNDPADAVSPFCQTLLDQASPWGYGPELLVALKAAIAQGGDLNQLCDYYGEQILPLNFLVSTDEAMAQQLIEQGADVNAKDGKGDTPLHYVGESVEMARSLITHGANVNASNSSGSTPLHNVFRQKTAAVMALLIEQGADVNASTPEGMTPLHFANTGDIAALLIEQGADMNARSDQNWTPLHYAVSNFDVAAQLIQSGADLTIQNREGAAIHASDLSLDVLPLLLDAGVDVNLRNQEGRTALHNRRFSLEIVALLLAAGADVNIQGNQGRTPLFDVNDKVAEQLLAAGADVNIQDSLGRTPLHQAVIEEESFFGLELVELFLGRGANPTIEDYQGETALDIARRLNKSDIASLFPSDGGTLVDNETTDSELVDSEVVDSQLLSDLQRQAQNLLQSARTVGQSRKVALSQLRQAAEVAQTISEVERRDRLLQDIGQALVEFDALEEAQAIAQAMNYEIYDSGYGLRPELEKAIIKAYIQSGQTAQALSIAENAPPNVRAHYWFEAVGALVDQNLPVEATALIGRIVDEAGVSYRQAAISRINQVYIGAEQFETAQTFLQQQSVSQASDEASRLREIALWAGRSGQLETARAIAQKIPEDHRAGMLVELAQIAQYQSQPALAKSLLEEFQQLPSGRNNDWQRSFEMATFLAETYADIGEADAARKVLITAEQAGAGAVQPNSYPTGNAAHDQWVSAFAKIGAFDRAMQLVDNASAGQRHAARLSLAAVYIDRRQYDSAITILNQVPNSALLPYLKRRTQLFDRIVEETLEQGKPSTAKRVAQVIDNPLDSVPVWIKISAFYGEKQQNRAAIDLLDRTLAMVEPLEKINYKTDRNTIGEVSNAGLLTAIAKAYWVVGQREQAIETAELAIASVRKFQSDSPSAPYVNNDLAAIAKLGRDWQSLEVQATAVREIEALLEAAASDEQPLISERTPYGLIRLVELAYNPNQAPSELFNRNLARLDTMLEQSDDYRLSVLTNLALLYSEINRLDKARTVIEEVLTLIEPLDANPNNYIYSQIAGIAIQNADLEDQFQILPRLSTAERLEVLTDLVQRMAGEGDTAQTMQYFDQLIQLSERSQSQSDRDDLLLGLAYAYENHSYLYGVYSPPLPRTSAAVALLMRLPQHMSDPYQQVGVWTILLRLDLSPAESASAYESLSATLKEIPDGYRKREMLWLSVENALKDRDFERATQVAYQLEGEYCETALGLIKTVRRA